MSGNRKAQLLHFELHHIFSRILLPLGIDLLSLLSLVLHQGATRVSGSHAPVILVYQRAVIHKCLFY